MVFSGKFIAAILASVIALGGGLAYVANQRAQREVQQQAEPRPLARTGSQSEAAADSPAEERISAVDTTVPATESRTPGTTGDTTPATAPTPEARTGGTGGEPEFDVVRVDENGNVVIAGRAEPGTRVDIVVGNRVVATMEADERGEFAAVLDEPLGTGTSALRLRATTPDGTTTDSDQEVTVFIEDPGGAPLVVAQDAEGPTEVLQEAESVVASVSEAPTAETAPAGPEPVAPKGDEAVPVLIRTVDVRPPRSAGGENEVVVAGSAPAGAPVRVYLRDLRVGETVTSETGDWSVRFNREMSPGRYVLRADQIDPETGNVVARARTRFRRAAIVAETARTQPKTDAGTQPVLTEDSNDMAVEKRAEARETSAETGLREAIEDDRDIDVSVVRGDSLWRISRNAYGRGIHYTVIFEANRSQITDPDLIFPGQVFTIPEFEEQDAGQ